MPIERFSPRPPELDALASKLLADCAAWAAERHPEWVAQVGVVAGIDSALQSLCYAEVSRSNGKGEPLICALAHAVAMCIAQQPAANRQRAVDDFNRRVFGYVGEILSDSRAEAVDVAGRA